MFAGRWAGGEERSTREIRDEQGAPEKKKMADGKEVQEEIN